MNRSTLLGDCVVDNYAYNRRPRNDSVNERYFVMDWWMAARPATLATWSLIDQRWSEYERRNGELGIGNTWAHFVWPQHIHDTLNASGQLRFSTAVRGGLARNHLAPRANEPTRSS